MRLRTRRDDGEAVAALVLVLDADRLTADRGTERAGEMIAFTRTPSGPSSIHTAGALYETFPAPEAHRILRRLEFHYTPKHASWLNMVEIEIGVLRGQCLHRRIGERKQLVSQIAAWEKQRNKARARIKWMFTVERARTKLARAYPDPTKES